MACAITTIDNPYDPFTQFELWLAYDLEKGYNSCAYLSRVTLTSDQMSSKEEEEEIEKPKTSLFNKEEEEPEDDEEPKIKRGGIFGNRNT